MPSDFQRWERIGIAGWLACIYDPTGPDFQALGQLWCCQNFENEFRRHEVQYRQARSIPICESFVLCSICAPNSIKISQKAMSENYFNYFTEIEQHFQQRRGGILLLSTLDWALIETWKNAGIPLEAVLRGIDAAFERYEKRPSKRTVNSLAYCAQEVLAAAEEMKEAAVGAAPAGGENVKPAGFQTAEIAEFLRRNAAQLDAAKLPEGKAVSALVMAQETAATLRALAADLESTKALPRLEDLERRLTVLEEKLFAALLAATSDDEIVAVRSEADRAMAPYRRKMPAAQIDQLQKQYVHERLLEKYGLPRLSLFYL